MGTYKASSTGNDYDFLKCGDEILNEESEDSLH